MKKRILALALSLCMMLSMMPTAYAGEGFLTLDGQQPEVSQPQEQPQQQEGFLTLDGQLPESDEPSRRPEEGVLTLDQPDLEVQEPTTPIISEESEQNEGVLFVQCDFCGYLDGNHADDCATQQPEEEIIVVKPAAERKASIVYSFTYQDTFDALMEADTLSVFESILDELTASQLEEFYDLLSSDELDALDEQEDELAQAAVIDFEKETSTKKTVTVERRASLFGAAQREMLRQLGYELIVDMFGWIVDAIDLPQNDYTVMEAISPETSADYQWQILADDDLWVDIYNETDSLIRVSYAMVANLLDRYDAVQVRCEITGEDGVTYTDPVEVCVDYTSDDVIIDAEEEPVVEDLIVEEGVVEDVVIEEPIVEEPIVEEPIVEEPIVEEPIVEEPIVEEPIVEEPIVEEPIVEEPIVEEPTVEEPIVEEPIVEEPIVEEPVVGEPVAQTFSVTRLGGTYAQPFTVSLLEAEEERTTFNVVINYVFENNVIVADPYTANLAKGSNFSATVTFPTVLGYLPYVGNDTETTPSLELNVSNIQEDVTYTVTYKPTNVDYTVIHYQQNAEDDNYTITATETLQGLTKSTVPDVAKTYPGFYALLYEKPEIAADGSTIVEIYYDRMYYLMNFDLDGGYGVEPIYARFGTPVGELATPTKAGYIFTGWTPAVPATVPVGGDTYTAQWELDETAKVSVVIWGENANDEGYSYIKTTEFYAKAGETIDYAIGNIVCGYDEEHTHGASCYGCDMTEHKHSAACCTLTAHTHSADCCTIEAHTHSDECCSIDVHEHNTGCYAGATDYSNSWLTETANEGEVRRFYGSKYIYIAGEWYYYTGSTNNGGIAPATCGQAAGTHADHTCVYDCGYAVEHTHGEGNCVYCSEPEHTHGVGNCVYCDLPEHTHTAACLTCKEREHTHTGSCYITDPNMDGSLWRYVKSDKVTVAADGSTVMNVYYDRTTFTLTFRANNNTVATITDKWGASISAEFGKAPFNTTYNGRAWKCDDSDKYGYALQTLDIMPKFNATFNLYDKNDNTLKTIYYYGENVGANVSETSWPTNTNNFTLLKQVDTYFNYATYEEEYHAIEGYKRYAKSISFNERYSNVSGVKNFKDNTLYLYYLRDSFNLDFNDGFGVVKTESMEYEETFSQFKTFVPDAPAAYEAGSVKFAGWYLNPECTGDPVDLDVQKMPAKNMILYAKWTAANHTVEFYLDQDAMVAGTKIGDSHPDLTVAHGSLVDPVPSEPENGDYDFAGWFYKDGKVEKAFKFETMAVTKDMKVYAKWSSNVLKEYTVYYKIQGTETEIADPIKGSGLAGTTKTFDAKGGTELDEGYQEGYFPLVKSHSLKLDIEDETQNTFIFWYVQKDAVPYTVYYVTEENPQNDLGTVELGGKTYYKVADTYTNSDNRKAVVTENFVPVKGYMPDAYQKRLIVDGNEGAVNEIIFYYSEDTEHAYYKITHYTENTEKNADGESTWTEYASSQIVGNIGATCTAESLKIDGFTYSEGISTASGVLTENGLELKLYYVRNEYPYQVRYLEQGTGKQLADPKNGTGKYGQVISESAIDIENYTAVAPTYDTLTIRIEESQTEAKLNIITFYYEEKEVTINYEVVGPEGCGTVTPEHEDLPVLSGEAKGSTATAEENYHFVGWYSDAACTKELTKAEKFVPEKVDGKNVAKTYYAKFEEDTVTITYVAVGNGSVSPTSETLGVVSGNATGSTATPSADHHFVGWYDNAECTGATISTNVEFKPAKVDGKNVAKTYYAKFEEDMVTITYVAVGPEGAVNFGTVDPTSETVKVLTEIASGSTATAGENYHFVGWYSDAACTQAVGASLVDANNKFSPAKVDNKNVEATYYAKFEENEATINYVAVGPEGCGTVTPASETVKVLSGTATGSTATASDNVYKFVGWFKDNACEQAVDASWVTGNAIKPVKAADAAWVDGTTYYAKFEYNLTSLTIKKNWERESTYGQDAIFTVRGEGKTITVVIPANSTSNEVTITGLTVGAEYTITENTDWAWRYTSSMKKGDEPLTDGKIMLEPTGNLVTCTNEIENQKWFDGNAYCENVYVPANNTITQLPKRKDEE